MMLEHRSAGDPITLRLSGRELYMIKEGLNEVIDEIDDEDLQTITGVDRRGYEVFCDELNALWRTLDQAERRAFAPGA